MTSKMQNRYVILLLNKIKGGRRSKNGQVRRKRFLTVMIAALVLLTSMLQTQEVRGASLVEGVYDPATLELDFGSVSSVEEFQALRPTQTQGVLSSGRVVMVDLDQKSWVPVVNNLPDGYPDVVRPVTIPKEFDPDKEGIYIYKAMIKEDGNYSMDEETWVEWRVNYFPEKDGYNQHERTIERLDRGLYAIGNLAYDAEAVSYVAGAGGGNYLSWRILVDEYAGIREGNPITFDVYRNGENIISLENITNYVDTAGRAGDIYVVTSTQNGVITSSKEVAALKENYISVPLQRPLPSYGKTGKLGVYRLNDTEAADVDGDGEYELIVKWYPYNGFDPGASSKAPSSPHIIDVYKMNGRALWRLFMGYSSPAGQHFDNFMVYDLDEDGKAELSILAHDGTRSYRPDENGSFAYLTTESGGYVFQPDDPSNSESDGYYVPSADGTGFVLSSAGEYASPVMDDRYRIDVVGDTKMEGIGIREDGFKGEEAEEYIAVFQGETGELIDYTDYYFSTSFFLKKTENQSLNTINRYNIGLAHIPEDTDAPGHESTVPAVVFNRAYYSDVSMAAYTLKDGRIKLSWKTYIPDQYQGGGNHNMVTGDMDQDGFDEIYLGGTAVDHDGTVLWAKNGSGNRDIMKHGDMIHMAAIFPDSDQLYVFTPVEDGSISTRLNYALSNGATGARVVGHTFGRADTGTGMLANVTPSPGYELWASSPSKELNGRLPNALYNGYGQVVSDSKPSVRTWSSYWDGDLLSELPDSNPVGGKDKSGYPMGVHKYNWVTGETETIASFKGTYTNNSTKNNPCLIADILGDWREEILIREANNETLRIYMTSIPTEYTIYTLMHDSLYRNGIANQNSTYNVPAHTGFYLGEDEKGRSRVVNFGLPTYRYRYADEVSDLGD